MGTNRLTETPTNSAFIKDAVAAGIDLIDTAYLYTGGESESTIGAAAAEMSRRPFVATKGGFRPGEGRPEVLREEIAESLRRLGVETIDLYYLHRVDPQTPLEDSLNAIKEYVDRGQIRHVGLSQVGIEQIEQGRRVLPITAVENEYSLDERGFDDVLDYATREGIVFVPFRPLHVNAGPVVSGIARAHEATVAQIALAWLLRRSPMTVPIPGTLSFDHVQENLAALDIELSDDEFEALTR